MENVKVDKDELLAALRENRDRHRAIFEEALEGYTREAQETLEQHLERLRAGVKPKTIKLILSVPEDHTKDYDRAIRMVEMHREDHVELSEFDFGQYVMDDWGWRRQWLAQNATYSVAATQALEEG